MQGLSLPRLCFSSISFLSSQYRCQIQHLRKTYHDLPRLLLQSLLHACTAGDTILLWPCLLEWLRGKAGFPIPFLNTLSYKFKTTLNEVCSSWSPLSFPYSHLLFSWKNSGKREHVRKQLFIVLIFTVNIFVLVFQSAVFSITEKLETYEMTGVSAFPHFLR